MALRRIIEEKTKIEGDMIQMRSNIRQCNKEREAAEDQVISCGNIAICILLSIYIYIYMVIASALEKPGTWVRLPASVRFFICSVASFLLCCPCEALEGPISTRVGII